MARQGLSLEDSIQDISKQYPLAITDNEDGDKQLLSQNKKQVFLNPAQLLAYNFGSRNLSILAGRGLGKTTFLSMRLYGCVTTLPKATGILAGATIKQIFSILMPNLVKSLEQLRGLREGVDFVRGQPNARWKWDKPLAVPRRWENVIAFPNGNVCICISTNSYAPANGLNLGYSLMDEARFANWANYVQSVRPTLRGEVYDHPGYRKWENPYYLSECFISDGGIIKKQQEWEQEELNQTEDINELICEMLAQLKYAEQYDAANGTNAAWKLAHSQKFTERLQYLRCKSRVFMRFSSLHNLSILGEDYIKARKRDMPDLLFRVQILGQKATLDKSQRYYPNFDMDVHGYTPKAESETDLIHSKYTSKYKAQIDIGAYTKKYDYEAPDLDELSTLGNNCTLDVDMQPGKPLFIAHDFNANVNTIVTAQEGKMDGINSAITLSSMFVVNPRMLEDLMEDWHKYYAPHRHTCKDVILYYDSTAKQGQSYASRAGRDEMYAFYAIIQRVLTAHGWNVILINLGSPMQHDIKFEFINACFAGKERLLPRINATRNDYLIASLENAIATMKFGKIHKYKGAEKKTTGQGLSEEDELGTNNYTDMSDSFDTLMRGMCKFGTRQTTVWNNPHGAWNRNSWGKRKW